MESIAISLEIVRRLTCLPQFRGRRYIPIENNRLLCVGPRLLASFTRGTKIARRGLNQSKLESIRLNWILCSCIELYG